MSCANGGGGTLTLPSPTHVHHVDVTSAVRSLRRSLSRSPSKFHLVTEKSPSISPQSPLSPSPSSPSKRPIIQSTASLTGTPTHTPSPLARPFPSSVKLSLRSAHRSKTVTPRAPSRTRMSPKSPLKRALSSTSDSGNSLPSSSSESSSGQENRRSGSISPTARKSFEKQKSLLFDAEIPPPINLAFSRLDGRSDSGASTVTTSSPLKRNDAIMNLDQASLGSPVAKRRSLHGSASFGHDFNVFDHGPTSSPPFEIHDDSSQEYQLSATSISTGNSMVSALGVLPRRSSSLRKSTLQQRHGDKGSLGRRYAAQESSASTDIATPVQSKNRPRLSLDQFIPPMSRESPFTSQGSLPNASVHVINQSHQPNHQPHPLSRTMTTSSSSSSLADDSPTHVPVHFGEPQRPKIDFSKSMPVGSLRPFALEAAAREHSSSETFATPENYKSVKPLPAAFMSTGLISKVNRNPEEPQLPRGVSKGDMPDTPCKKPANGFPTIPAPVPGSAIAKARHIRHSFGTPSTPFNPHGNQPTQGTFGKGVSSFGSGFGNKSLTRRGSFLSLDGYDNAESPENKSDSQSSNDYDLPPTPTKQALTPSMGEYTQQEPNEGPNGLRTATVSNATVGYSLSQKFPRMSSKLNLLTTRDDPDVDESDVSIQLIESPTTVNFRFSPNTSFSMSSFSRSRASRGQTVFSPAPLIPVSLTTSFVSPSRKPGFAKFSHVAPASPLERIDFIERISPRTPQESMLPPTSGSLSIFGRRDSHMQKQSLSGSSAMPPPATPTTGRDYFATFGNQRKSVTPINDLAVAEVDEALISRFDKVELIGTGEFSQVYRVTQPMKSFEITQPFYFGTSSSPLSGRTPPMPMPEQVFAVKKSRQPYQGIRDRQRKLQEVNVLKALGHSEHVVHLIDTWEAKDYLYIQTEFCEEGSLDMFLAQVGRKGRLDDFRIWKILLELGEGLKHIHDSGYIHLDLKPANIFINFEGLLKVGDFGMATAWPAQSGIEGEGDREYIGPEILLGHYDKPADVFALGLIMLEIAGNVQLPDNGPTWQRLRSGDMSDVPSLTWSSASAVLRDATGVPIEDSDTSIETFSSDDELDTQWSPSMTDRKRHSVPPVKSLSHNARNLFGSVRRGELHRAPAFMRDQFHEHALDRIVRWMISPTPEDRPTVHQILESEGICWVETRRRAGATVFEGNWGPADAVLVDDAEMMDV